MKFLPINTQKRVSTEDSLGHGMDAAIVLALFLLAGYGLDRLFATMPVFMIVMTVLGSVGLFYKFKYRYDARMDELVAERRGSAAPTSAAPTGTAATGTAPTGTAATGTAATGTAATGTAPTSAAPTGTGPTSAAPTGTAPTSAAPIAAAVSARAEPDPEAVA